MVYIIGDTLETTSAVVPFTYEPLTELGAHPITYSVSLQDDSTPAWLNMAASGTDIELGLETDVAQA